MGGFATQNNAAGFRKVMQIQVEQTWYNPKFT